MCAAPVRHLSVLQAESSLGQVFDQARYGRAFVEQAIATPRPRPPPTRIALLFARRVTKRIRGTFRARAIRAHAAAGTTHTKTNAAGR